jgi:hypothetical protein
VADAFCSSRLWLRARAHDRDQTDKIHALCTLQLALAAAFPSVLFYHLYVNVCENSNAPSHSAEAVEQIALSPLFQKSTSFGDSPPPALLCVSFFSHTRGVKNAPRRRRQNHLSVINDTLWLFCRVSPFWGEAEVDASELGEKRLTLGGGVHNLISLLNKKHMRKARCENF